MSTETDLKTIPEMPAGEKRARRTPAQIRAELEKQSAALAEKAKRLQARADALKGAEEEEKAKKWVRKNRTRALIVLGSAADKLARAGKVPLETLTEMMSDKDREWFAEYRKASLAILSRAGGEAPAPGGKP